MSLASLIDKLTTLFSKNFVLAAFAPILVFVLCNAALFYFYSEWFRVLVRTQAANPRVLDMTILSVVLAVGAYMLSAVSSGLRRILEGKSLFSKCQPLDQMMRASEQRKLDAIVKRFRVARHNNGQIDQAKKTYWKNLLREAAVKGQTAVSKTQINDPKGLLLQLLVGFDPVSAWLGSPWPDKNQLANLPDDKAMEIIVDRMNEILDGPLIFEEFRFANIDLRLNTKQLVEQKPEGIVIRMANRLLLEDAYPSYLLRMPDSTRASYSRTTSKGGAKIQELFSKRQQAEPPTVEELNDAVQLLVADLLANDISVSPLKRDHKALEEFICKACVGLYGDGLKQKIEKAAAMGMRTHEDETVYDSEKSAEFTRNLAGNSWEPETAVKKLCRELKQSDERISPLAEDRDALIELFDYAELAWGPLEIRYFNESQSRFGAAYVAPTSMGNVAESMQNRALTRYNLDLETFWSRLQVVIQGQQDKGFYTTLQDVRTQLDFLVACCWLSGLTWVFWALALLVMGDHLLAFLLAALAGPAVIPALHLLH